nr:delta-1-pyrroline-5-carboxylate synthase [Quercus suber]
MEKTIVLGLATEQKRFSASLFYFPHLQLDVTSTQLLVTDNDFRDKAFRNQLSETVQSLLTLKVIPIFKENDAVSTRRAPYEEVDVDNVRQRVNSKINSKDRLTGSCKQIGGQRSCADEGICSSSTFYEH